MNHRFLSVPTIAIAGVVAALATAPVTAQSGSNYKTPRTPWGDPDLQGTYSNRTITPFERAADVKGREFFTREEAAALEQSAQQQNGDEGRNKGTRGDVERAYNDFWWDRGTTVTSLRTSLVVDPPDGRVPPQTQEAKLRAAEEGKRPAYRGGGAAGGRPARRRGRAAGRIAQAGEGRHRNGPGRAPGAGGCTRARVPRPCRRRVGRRDGR